MALSGPFVQRELSRARAVVQVNKESNYEMSVWMYGSGVVVNSKP